MPPPHPMPPSFRCITTCGFKAPLLPTVRSGRVSAYAPRCVSPKRCPRRSTCGSSPPKIIRRGPSPGGRASRGAYSWWPVTTWRYGTWYMLKLCTSAHPSCFTSLYAPRFCTNNIGWSPGLAGAFLSRVCMFSLCLLGTLASSRSPKYVYQDNC